MIDLSKNVSELLEEMPQDEGAALLRFDADEDVLLLIVRGTLARTMFEDVKVVMEKFKAVQI